MNCVFCNEYGKCPVRVELYQQELWDCFDARGYECKFDEQVFLTPSQYEKRTGKKWNGAVWIRFETGIQNEFTEWEVYKANSYLRMGREINMQILCANSPEPPPDDYVTEEEV